MGSKRKSTDEHQMKEGKDRFSELSDSSIIKILSLCDDMKDVVRTSVLSKRWNNYWTRVDNLVFKCEMLDTNSSNKSDKLDRFMLFVDSTLMQCVSPKINKFSVTAGSFHESQWGEDQDLEFDFRFDDLVEKWLHFLLTKDVQHLKLGFIGLDYVIPVSLYNCCSLSRLEIDEVGKQYYYRHNFLERSRITSLVTLEEPQGILATYRYKKKFDVRWNVLKTLYFKRVHVPQEFMAELLLGCPVLETLVLDRVGGVSRLVINSPSVSELKLLNLSSHSVDGNVHLYVFAPLVKKLEVGGSFVDFNCHLDNVISLNKVNLTFSYECIDHLDELDEYDSSDLWSNMIDALLKPVCDVIALAVGAELLKALSIFELTSGHSLIFGCKDLSIHSPIPVHEVPGIVCLLASSPNLENFVLNVMPWQDRLHTYDSKYEYAQYVDKIFASFNGVDYLSQRKEKFPNLKNVKINCREQSYYGNQWRSESDKHKCFELKIAAYIFKHAPCLEKLVILSPKSNSSGCGTRYVSLLSSKCMIGKKARRWVLKKTDYTYEYTFDR